MAGIIIDFGFIYCTTNNINGMKYIGQKTFNKGHKTYLGSGIRLTRAIKKYGRENFSRDIIELCSSREDLNEREKYWISYYDALNDENYYNLCIGGFGTSGHRISEETRHKMRNKVISDESRLKMSESAKNRKPMSEETRKKLSKSHKNQVNKPHYHSEETKKKLSELKKGKAPYKMTDEIRKNMSKAHKPMSEEARKNMSKAHKGRIITEEEKQKISASLKNHIVTQETRDKLSIPIVQYDLDGNFIKNWSSIKSVKEGGYGEESVRSCCKGNRQTYKGYIWKHKDSTNSAGKLQE